MTDEPKTPLGHLHDLKPSEVASFHMTMIREAEDETRQQKKSHLVSGTGMLLFGVDGDQITVGLMTRRSSSMDPNVWMEGAKMDINAAEHTIRALITVVTQAKKNAIDKPSVFGNTYSALPLTKEGE